ncbi:hypothetical protein RJ641_028397 [Dillenia turbinata]|uniref:Uncharacterized protein n=1 Tax=Dillenia turbinata TaxID=194707 RepID=A0AAN8ZRG3_9MAGN
MEGLIPFVCRAIKHYKNGGQVSIRTLLSDSPSASYIRLPGDSGRFQAPDVQFLRSDYGFSTPASAISTSATTKVLMSTGVISPPSGKMSFGLVPRLSNMDDLS